MLSDLDARQAELQKNMLRISGAIQVLEEELAKCDSETTGAQIVEMKGADELDQ